MIMVSLYSNGILTKTALPLSPIRILPTFIFSFSVWFIEVRMTCLSVVVVGSEKMTLLSPTTINCSNPLVEMWVLMNSSPILDGMLMVLCAGFVQISTAAMGS